MATSALFLIFYGTFRFIIEFIRVPDSHIGYLALNWLTDGAIVNSTNDFGWSLFNL